MDNNLKCTASGNFNLETFLKSPTRDKLDLCGSRWFASIYPDIIKVDKHTDWDFFCGPDAELEKELITAGFYLVEPAAKNFNWYPFDLLPTRIYQTLTKEVQVIVRTAPGLYLSVMKSIMPEFYRDFLWKSGPNKPPRAQIQSIMNQLFDTALRAKHANYTITNAVKLSPQTIVSTLEEATRLRDTLNQIFPDQTFEHKGRSVGFAATQHSVW